MENLLLFAVASIGLTHIIVDSHLMEGFREWVKATLPYSIHRLFDCYQCCGTWVGFFTGWALIDSNIFVVFLSGCASSFLSSFASTYLNYLEAQTIINIDTEVDSSEIEEED